MTSYENREYPGIVGLFDVRLNFDHKKVQPQPSADAVVVVAFFAESTAFA